MLRRFVRAALDVVNRGGMGLPDNVDLRSLEFPTKEMYLRERRRWEDDARNSSPTLRSYLEKRKRESQAKIEAEYRAIELLYSHLDLAQRKMFVRKFKFNVRGSHSGRKYLIDWGREINVYGPDYKYCLAPHRSYGIPIADVMLAQKLFIETDEPGFRSEAVKWRL